MDDFSFLVSKGEGGGEADGADAAARPDSLSPTAVANFWSDFDMEGLRATLDDAGLAIAGHQESSVSSRKLLAERTKEFRRGLSAEAFKQVSPLLKMYQEEVDRLTGRAKASEAAFLDVFKRLYEAPDPAPAIAGSLKLASRAAELEAAASKSARELADFKAESKELKNQDLTIRRLEDKVRALEAEVAERREELEARSAEESRQREVRLAEELERAQAGMEALRRMHQATQAQLFSAQERGEAAAAAARTEAEFATAEVERAQAQLAALERERNGLLARVQEGGGAATSGASSAAVAAAPPAEVAALRDELRTQRELASRLQAEVSSAAQRAAADAASAAARLAAVQAALEAKEAHCSALEAELAGRPAQRELDDVRQQVRVLRAVVHNSLDDEVDGSVEGGANGAAGGGGSGGVGPLEAALLGKNRHLEHKLTMARLEVAEARGEVEAAAARVAELESDLERSQALVAQLEEDLLAADGAQRDASTPAGDADASGAEGSAVAGGGEQTMLSVLVSQRDRLKSRIQELEGGAAATAQKLMKARTELEAARADNVALVERLRFVQGYAAGGGGGKRAPAGGEVPGDLEAGAGVVGKYMKEYEDGVNPFTAFRAREREARRRQMPLQDRAAYAVGSALVSGNKVARSAIVVYALALHFVAFLVLAGFSRHQEGKIEKLEELCEKVRPLGAAGGALAGELGMGVDPVVGGSIAAVAQGGANALRRLLFGL